MSFESDLPKDSKWLRLPYEGVVSDEWKLPSLPCDATTEGLRERIPIRSPGPIQEQNEEGITAHRP